MIRTVVETHVGNANPNTDSPDLEKIIRIIKDAVGLENKENAQPIYNFQDPKPSEKAMMEMVEQSANFIKEASQRIQSTNNRSLGNQMPPYRNQNTYQSNRTPAPLQGNGNSQSQGDKLAGR